MDKEVLENQKHRVCLNHAQIAANTYDTHTTSLDRGTVMRRTIMVEAQNSNMKTTSLKTLLRFRAVVPHLVRLLNCAGIWTLDCEEVYMALTKCRVEAVSIKAHSLSDPHVLNLLVKQAMVYVVAACADQAEEINRILKNNEKQSPYHLFEVLPGGAESLKDTLVPKKFSDGTETTLSSLFGSASLALDAIQEVAWNSNNNFFGPVVCSILH